MQYPLAALHGISKAFNATAPIASRITQTLIDPEIVTLVLQEGTDAVVVTMLPSGGHDVMMVGTPAYKTRCDVNQLCQAIAHEWRLVHFSPVAAINAAVDCVREVNL
jgi:hypothetical protein